MIAIGEARYNWKTARTMEQAVSETDHVKRMSEQPASMVRHAQYVSFCYWLEYVFGVWNH